MSTESTSMRAGCPCLTRLGCTLAAIVCLSGCAHAGARPSAVTEHMPLSSSSPPAALAAHVASKRLAHVVLPSGTKPLGNLSPGTQGLLSHPPPSEAFAHIVDRDRFWTARQSPATLLAFVTRQDSNGGTLLNSGNLDKEGHAYYWSEEFAFPITARSLRAERLSVAIARSGSREFALRIDARVAWRTPRPSDSLVPQGARWLTIAVARERITTGRHTLRWARPLNTHEPKAVALLTNAVNSLPVAEPVATTCRGDEPDLHIRLTFRAARDGPPLALVGADPDTCGAATAAITIPGRPALGLESTAGFIALAERAFASH
jgi:hypothetical protein